MAGGYKYKLENILELRQRIEDQKKNEFGIALKRLNEEKEKLQNLIEASKRTNREFEIQSQKGMNIVNLKLILQGVAYYKDRIKSQNLSVKMANDYLNDCRTELIKATQERKAMEKMKEKDYIKFIYKEQKKEEKMVDELVSFKQSNVL